jgi:hypothetical protein
MPRQRRRFARWSASSACRRCADGVPALAEQVLRTLLWHLDRIVDLQPRCSRARRPSNEREQELPR